jgi:hypothetical protein
VDASEFQFIVGDVEKVLVEMLDVEPVGEEGPAMALLVVSGMLRCGAVYDAV